MTECWTGVGGVTCIRFSRCVCARQQTDVLAGAGRECCGRYEGRETSDGWQVVVVGQGEGLMANVHGGRLAPGRLSTVQPAQLRRAGVALRDGGGEAIEEAVLQESAGEKGPD